MEMVYILIGCLVFICIVKLESYYHPVAKNDEELMSKYMKLVEIRRKKVLEHYRHR